MLCFTYCLIYVLPRCAPLGIFTWYGAATSRQNFIRRNRAAEFVSWNPADAGQGRLATLDSWWIKSNIYSSATTYSILQSGERVLDETLCKRLWSKPTPSNVSIFGWRLLLNRLPTKDELIKRGSLDLAQLPCTLCGNEPESIDHVFLNCPKSRTIWRRCLSWWGIPFTFCQTQLWI